MIHTDRQVAEEFEVAGDTIVECRSAVSGDDPIRPCPNKACVDGYAPRGAAGVLRVCTGCDGLGFLRSTNENRRRYHSLRTVAAEIELQSRSRRGALDDLSLALLLGEAATNEAVEALLAGAASRH